jgi:hypothetical protein
MTGEKRRFTTTAVDRNNRDGFPDGKESEDEYEYEYD